MQKQPLEIGRFAGVPGFEPVKGNVPCDGGFFFSPVVLVANKALWERPDRDRAAFFRSYSTATADGVLALWALGGGHHDQAADWLSKHWQVDVAGIPGDAPEPWVAALRYYNFAVMCEAAVVLGWPEGRLAPFAERIVSLAREDGSFVNLESTLMKEDDPVLATTLALIALGNVARKSGAESR